ncbi:hypothetical protein MJN51_32815, partial [Salmonella enterica subsp. enterica serovar Kentucky]|nr:hypothetical protein [Salmonella enterica subsp. enterica serovar Kentucky]
QAIASYDKLFKGYPPEDELAVEYWTTVAKLPARRHEAINQLHPPAGVVFVAAVSCLRHAFVAVVML